MQVLMSDSLLSRVSTEMPTREKLLASFVFADREIKVPVTAIFWVKEKLEGVSLGIADVSVVTTIIKDKENASLAIADLDLYFENIFRSSYNLVEHNNYSYELSFRLEGNDG